jgi:polar amino acid transport system substrate-binding protein
MKLLLSGCLLVTCFALFAEPLRIVSSEFVPHNGEHLPQQGYAIELVRQIFASQQQQVSFEFLPWPRALKLSQKGEAVAIVTLWFDQDRAQYLYYPTPLYSNFMRFYHRNQFPIDLIHVAQPRKRKLRLGMVRGYSYHPSITHLPVTFVELNSDLESLKMLALGRVDFVICEQLVAEHILSNELSSYQSQISSVGPVLEEKPMYLAFSKAHPAATAMMQVFERGLQHVKQQQKLQRLLPHYRQSSPSESQQNDELLPARRRAQ